MKKQYEVTVEDGKLKVCQRQSEDYDWILIYTEYTKRQDADSIAHMIKEAQRFAKIRNIYENRPIFIVLRHDEEHHEEHSVLVHNDHEWCANQNHGSAITDTILERIE